MTPGAPVGGRPGVCLLNLGCRVNRVELDLMASELEAAGAVLVDEAEADAIVVNTCAVTGEAEAKTRKAVRRAAEQVAKLIRAEPEQILFTGSATESNNHAIRNAPPGELLLGPRLWPLERL